MIRMGRNNKSELPSEAPQFQENYTSDSGNLYGARQENAMSANRAVSESESMARDLKEGRLSGFVGSGTTLTGETNFQAMLRVDGHLTGRVTSENGTLLVGSGGQVDANVLVASAIVMGTVNGDIVAMEKIELGRTATVVGNIQTPHLIIEDGAVLEGSCSMMKSKEALEQRANEARSPRATNDFSSIERPEESAYPAEETEEEEENLTEAATS